MSLKKVETLNFSVLVTDEVYLLKIPFCLLKVKLSLALLVISCSYSRMYRYEMCVGCSSI